MHIDYKHWKMRSIFFFLFNYCPISHFWMGWSSYLQTMSKRNFTCKKKVGLALDCVQSCQPLIKPDFWIFDELLNYNLFKIYFPTHPIVSGETCKIKPARRKNMLIACRQQYKKDVQVIQAWEKQKGSYISITLFGFYEIKLISHSSQVKSWNKSSLKLYYLLCTLPNSK